MSVPEAPVLLLSLGTQGKNGKVSWPSAIPLPSSLTAPFPRIQSPHLKAAEPVGTTLHPPHCHWGIPAHTQPASERLTALPGFRGASGPGVQRMGKALRGQLCGAFQSLLGKWKPREGLCLLQGHTRGLEHPTASQ